MCVCCQALLKLMAPRLAARPDTLEAESRAGMPLQTERETDGRREVLGKRFCCRGD